jgi:hypothetical protein
LVIISYSLNAYAFFSDVIFIDFLLKKYP